MTLDAYTARGRQRLGGDSAQVMDESSAATESRPDGSASALTRAVIAERYRVLRVLGEGSSGTVYLCVHTALNKEVAVKVLHRDLAHNADLVARFTREAQTAAKLDHPSSVHVMDFGQDRDGTLYLAMEYVDGPDLALLLERKLPLDDERIVHFMTCILSALSAAHALGIVHRDLKPENVLVRLAEPGSSEPDSVKVCDFGVAQFSPVRMANGSVSAPISTQTRRVTGDGMMVGTPWYMSPEQARAQALDARSDIYSAGVVLFQLLTRTLPFVGDDIMAVALAHCTTPPPPPSGYCAVHPGLEAVCLKALSKTPDARYQSATEMLVALREAMGLKVASRSLARTSRAPSTGSALVRVSVAPERTSSTPLATASVQLPATLRIVRPSLLVAGVATTLLGVVAVPRLLPSQQHATVSTLSAVATRSMDKLGELLGTREKPQPTAAAVPIQNDPELPQPTAAYEPMAAPLAAATDPLPESTEAELPTGMDGMPLDAPSQVSVAPPVEAKPAAVSVPRRSAAPVVAPAAPPKSASVGAMFPHGPMETHKLEAPAPQAAAVRVEPVKPAAAPVQAPAPQPAAPVASTPAVEPVPVVPAVGTDTDTETPGQAAAKAIEIALTSLPKTPAPVAAKVAPAPAKPQAPAKITRVDVNAERLPPGISRASLRGALPQLSLLACYSQAQQRTPLAELPGTTLELKTNTSGRIVWAHVTNGALPAPLRECLEQVARTGIVRGGEVGEVQATLSLLPSP
jgi:eukaryotic-like serine/threonine-protein kinase